MRLAFFLLLAMAPLPRASVTAVFQWAWIMYVAFVAVIFVSANLREPKIRQFEASLSTIPAAAFFLFLGFVLWGLARAFVPLDLPPTIQVDGYEILPSVNVQSLKIACLFLMYLVIFLLTLVWASRPGNRSYLLNTASLVAFACAAYGLIVYTSGNETILWFKKMAYPESLTSTFVNRNSFAAFMGLGLLATLASAAEYSRRHAGAREGKHWGARLVETYFSGFGWSYVAAALVIYSALLLTGSRAGIFTSMCGGLTFAALVLGKNSQFKRRLPLVIGVGVLVLLAGIELSGGVLISRLLNEHGEQRWQAYALTLEAIADHPLVGTGLGSFDYVFPRYRTDAIEVYFDRAHNDYLEMILTAGIPAAIALFTSLFLLVRRMFAIYGASGDRPPIYTCMGIAASVQLGLHSGVDFSLQVTAVSILFSIMLGVSLAQPRAAADSARQSAATG